MRDKKISKVEEAREKRMRERKSKGRKDEK